MAECPALGSSPACATFPGRPCSPMAGQARSPGMSILDEWRFSIAAPGERPRQKRTFQIQDRHRGVIDEDRADGTFEED
jgi:hypothetical protein